MRGFSDQVSAMNKFQITNTKQITMTGIQNSKQLAFDIIWDLDIVICNFGLIRV
jgi:hypothetical protein